MPDEHSPADHSATPKKGCSSTVVVAWLAGLLLPLFAFYAFVYPQIPARLAYPSADLIPKFRLWSFIVDLGLPIPQAARTLGVTLVLAAALCFAIYAIAIYIAWSRQSDKRGVHVALAATFIFFTAAALAFPNYNTDIFNYIATGRVASIHHENPYTVASDAFPQDPIYQYAGHQYTGTPGDNKLGVWMLVDTGLASMSRSSPVNSLLIYRGAFLLINFANVLLVLQILQRINPRRSLAGIIVYGWNPIVVTAGQSKVDTLMVSLLLIAIFLIIEGRQIPAIVMLTLSALVKLLTLPLLGLLLLQRAAAKRWQDFVFATGAVLLTAILVYIPFIGAHDLLRREVSLIFTSEGSPKNSLIRYGASVLFLGLIIILANRFGSSIEEVTLAWSLLALYFATFLTVIGFSWYLMVMIAVVAVAADLRVVVPAIAVCFAAFLVNTAQSASLESPIPVGRAQYVLLAASVCLAALISLRRRGAL